ncbi:P-loop containing nucleoside triphosphate hydrolase protein [Lactifluus volemus]|nr:P-loop containing nucleoside triphosphate hydrolase protein [Lactifluus volemus]
MLTAGTPSSALQPLQNRIGYRPHALSRLQAASPLAERLRPNDLDEFVGQTHLTGPNSFLSTLAEKGAIGSLILWGPPGCGKTTLARLIAKRTDANFRELSATIAKNTLQLTGSRTIIFLDEIHRFTRSQQDIFLPFLERGYVQLIGATTENPSFKLNGALLSRCRVFVLEQLTDEQIVEIIKKAIARLTSSDEICHGASPLFSQYPHITEQIITSMASLAAGDARAALSLLEHVILAPADTSQSALLASLKHSVATSYDRTGGARYDLISALHKCIRGNQGGAALYWLARMLEADEDPMYIARRLVVCASEDVGMADPHALPLVSHGRATSLSSDWMPECRINLAHVVTYLSEAPKSTRAFEAYNRARELAKQDMTLPVPVSIRNAPTRMMKQLGYGEGYKHQPHFAHPVTNDYLPPQISGEVILLKEGDLAGKKWDEDALRQWEVMENRGEAWVGRPAS